VIQQTMFNPAVSSVAGINVPSVASPKTPAEMTQSFSQFLDNALSSVEGQEKQAHALTGQYMLGQVDVSTVMIAAEQAQLSLQLTSQIRNKVIEAYQEIMRTQL